jgi:tetratricopeptide (TPR) repeat protein
LFAKQRIGLCSWKLKDYDNAKEYLHQALNLDKEEKSTYYYLGLLYMDLKEYTRAKHNFTMAILKEKPDIDNEHYNLGLIAQIEKKPKEAIKNFKKSYYNNQRNHKALYELAIMTDLYYKDKTIALKHYENYLERFPKINTKNTKYIKKRIREIKENLFMKEK